MSPRVLGFQVGDIGPGPLSNGSIAGYWAALQGQDDSRGGHTYWSLALDTRRVSYSESLETHVDDLECQLGTHSLEPVPS
jgi:hypothetical protein